MRTPHDEYDEALRELYLSGTNQKECAVVLGIGEWFVRSHLRAMGIELRHPRGGPAPKVRVPVGLSKEERRLFLKRAAWQRYYEKYRGVEIARVVAAKRARALRFFEFTNVAAILAGCTPSPK